MLLNKLFYIWVLSVFVNAHEPDTTPIDTGLSLPKIIALTSARQLTNWEVRGSTSVNNGRLLLTPESTNGRQEGQIWNKNYKLDKKSFTIDLTFRATGSIGKTGNGFVFWLLNDSQGNVDKLVRSDTSFYGGPSKFDGLALVIDSNGPLGSTLRGYSNDNSKEFDIQGSDFFKQDFGKCIIGYQDSQVPSTLKLSYEGLKNQLRVSIDNKLCFETTKFKIPTNENNFIIGATAASGKFIPEQPETFEIFKINVYNHILSSEQNYDEIELAAQPIIVTKNEKGEITSRVQGLRYTNKEEDPIEAPEIKPIDHINEDSINKILAKLSNFDAQLSEKLSHTMQRQEVETADLQRQIEQLSSQNNILEKYLKEVDRKLHKLVLTEEDKKQQKETYRIEELQKNEQEKNSTEKIFNSIKIFIYLLLALVVALGAFIYRLRSDIKHAKLL